MSQFVHLHVHSHYSLLDGLGKIDELIARAKELEMPALALTDHGNMHGAVEFYTKCKKAGIKPIIGVEAYLSPRGMLDRVPKVDSTAYHQVLLAKDDVGYRNLLFLVSEAHTKGMYYKPRIDLPLLAAHSKGIIATSSCLAGMIPEAIMAGDMEKAIALTRQFVDMFEGDFYLEMQHHPSLDKQMRVNEGLKAIAKELSLPLIATSDVHYVRKEDKDTHEVLLAINTGKDLASDDRMSLADVDLFMHDEEFFKEVFPDTPEIIENTAKIAEKCDLKLTLGENIIPDFDCPEGFTPDTYLEKLCNEGLRKRYGDAITDVHTERLSFELATINKMGFASYFLIVADYVNWAKSQNIYVGPGRGSAAGSIVSYSLGITDMDPLPFGFLFERFLNPDRISMPDIDMDFADDDRDKVIGYVRQKYGEDHVAGMATFGTMMGRAAVRDVGRVLGMTYAEVDEIAKLVPPPVQGKHIPLKLSIQNVPELKQRYEADPRMKKLLDFARKLEGTVRHASQHACAFVICKEPTVYYTPVQPAQRGREGVVTQYSMKPIEEIGLLKMDFLGLSNLTIMRNAVRIIRKVYGAEIDIHNLPMDDKKTYELLSRGETTGVFQLESDGMKRYIKELKPTEFNDIIAMCALYRPGPMANIPTYIARKHGKEPVQYLHPKLANAFAKTYGIAVYQEQVMQASKDLAGFTGGEADTLRKAIGKKIPALMAEMKSKFVEGCKKHSDIDEDLADKIWKDFEEFAAYGFVLAHAGCYALIAYQTAYLKANYPAAFFAALMTSNADNLDKMSIELEEAKTMGLQVLPPDINESFPEFGVVRGEGKEYIRFGLGAIKNVGLGVAESIVEERTINGPYTSLTNMLTRLGPSVLNKRVLEALGMTGAFDRWGERNALVQSVDTMTKFLSNGKKDTNQVGLFGAETPSLVRDIVLMDVPPAEQRIYLEWEKMLLGIYLSGHPLKAIEHIVPQIATKIATISVAQEGQNQRVAGMIMDLRAINTKTGDQMAFAKLEDPTGTLELVIFPRTWAEAKIFCQKDRYIVADGRVDTR
ncbi:MAG TPA: DNA polymerase III subunit alpha, partial [Patescibacteria group bacterium]